MNDPSPPAPHPAHAAATPVDEAACGVARTVVAASVRLFLDGIVLGLQRRGEIRVTGEAMDAAGALAAVLATRPEVVLIDIGMTDAMTAITSVLDGVPATRVIVFAVDDRHDDLLLACAEAGVSGWIGRDGSLAELIAAIHHAARGELVCTARMAGLMARRLATLAGERRSAPSATLLTPREQDVAELLGRGCSNKSIARTLSLQLTTVKNHVHSILSKLGASSRSEAGMMLRAAEHPGRSSVHIAPP
jgi:two-component system, NarL family, nitrate/nitrite response regulator NarL